MSAASTGQAPRAPQIVERFVKQLNITYKAVKLYPLSSHIPQDNALIAVDLLRQILARQPAVQLTVTKEGLYSDSASVFPQSAAFASFAQEFYRRNLAEVRFHAGCTPDEIVKFLSVLDNNPEVIAASGGFEANLWELRIDSITVTDVTTRIVDHEATEEGQPEQVEGEAWPPDPWRIEEIVTDAAEGRPRDQRLLVRIIRDPSILVEYLAAPLHERGVAPDEAQLTARISQIAHAMRFEVPEEQEAALRALAEGIMDLEPEMRARLVRTRLLDEARLDGMVADVVRQMTLDEMLDTILHDVSDTPETRAGLARAIRNLATVNLTASREGVMRVAERAMRARGASDGFIAGVMEGAAPQRLQMSERTRSSEGKPVENILRLVDFAPAGSRTHAYEEDAGRLRVEATRGITDGDVLAALVSIAMLDHRPEQFASIMALLEDSIGVLVDSQEFEVAADAAEALTTAEDDPSLSDGQRSRVTEVLKVLTRPASMRKITTALRVYRNDSAEHAACRRLLAVLGGHTISALLEVLAKEQDMQARKAIVDLVSGMADRFIPELGVRVSDQRWYFVRNVVAILASTRDPKVLPYIERTIRHPDARVRRETIRALSCIRDALADEMLMTALQDDDAQNVQLAARYLGMLKIRGAEPLLEDVARGTSRGNHDSGPRVEAIEALGRIASPSSMPVLQELTRQRGLIGRGREREIRAAAEGALTAIKLARHKGGDAE